MLPNEMAGIYISNILNTNIIVIHMDGRDFKVKTCQQSVFRNYVLYRPAAWQHLQLTFAHHWLLVDECGSLVFEFSVSVELYNTRLISLADRDLHHKCTAWKAWMSFREVDDAFQMLSTCDLIDDETMKSVERFAALMYDRTSTCTLVNQCRRVLYTVKNRAIENIPPTADALL